MYVKTFLFVRFLKSCCYNDIVYESSVSGYFKLTKINETRGASKKNSKGAAVSCMLVQ